MKNVKIFIITLILIFSFTLLNGQTNKIDSLKNILQQHTEKDTIKVNLLNKLAYFSLNIKDESALKFGKEAEEMADDLVFFIGKADALFLIGEFYYYKPNYTKAIEYYKKSLQVYIAIKNKSKYSECLNSIGISYKKLGDYSKALEYYSKSLKISTKLRDDFGVSSSLNNIGIIYKNQGDYSKALEYFLKSLKIEEEQRNKDGISICYNNIGSVYLNNGSYPNAYKYYNKSLKIRQELEDKKGIASSYNNIGYVYQLKGKYSIALEYYQKSLEIKKELGNQQGIVSSYINIGEIYELKEDFQTALIFYKKSLDIAKTIKLRFTICVINLNFGKVYLKMGNSTKALYYTYESLNTANELKLINIQSQANKQLSEIYLSKKKYKLAYLSFFKYKELSDSIFNKENIVKLTQLEEKFKYNQERKIFELKQQKKDALITKEIKYHKTIKNIFILALFIAILIIILFRRIVRIRKMANRMLRKKNNQINKQKEYITEQNTQLKSQKEELIQYKEYLEYTVEQRTSRLQKALQKAEESDQLKTEFIRNISHEIRTPLNGVLGFANILNKKNLPSSKIEQYTSIIQSSSHQLMRIVDDIIEISQLGTKQVNLIEKQICLNDLLLEVFLCFNIKAKETKIALYLKKGLLDKESTIIIDDSKLNKIISNLLENALKFTNVGFVEFGYVMVNKELELYVKDTGIGIKQESQEVIFKRFSQEEKSLRNNVGGLGLGLSIAKENAELLGGKITLKSEKGKGSTFFVTIPYKTINT